MSTPLSPEKEELEKDLKAFYSAYNILRDRVIESEDSAPWRYPSLRQWSGTCAVMGALELAIHAVERTIEEYEKLVLEQKPKLEVLDGGKSE